MSKIKQIFTKEIDIKSVLPLIIGLLIIVVYGYYFLYPRYKIINEKVYKIEEIKKSLDNHDNLENEINSLKAEYQQLNNDVNKMNMKLSYDMEDGMFLIGLSKKMDRLGIELTSYSIDDIIEYDTFYAIPTTISVKGNYIKVRELMSYMEEQGNVSQILDFGIEILPVERPKPITVPAVKDEEGNIIEDEKIIQPETPKNTGEVTATFKFIMYSSDTASIVLEYDNPNSWKPGRTNPFIPVID